MGKGASNRFSLAAFWAVAVLTVGASFISARWNLPFWKGILTADPLGYYAYLPATFMYGDLEKLGWIETIEEKHIAKDGAAGVLGIPPKKPENRVLKYSSGLAVMESPFFFAAWAVARPLGFEADGFSKPFQISIAIGGMLAAILGLWFLRRFLRRFFSDRVAAVALVMIGLGTNFHHYAATDYAHTHVWLFALLAVLLHFTAEFYEKPTVWRAVGIGGLVGLAILTRPTEVVVALVPLLFGLDFWSKKVRGERLGFWKMNWKKVVVAVLAAAAVGSIQLFYWKTVTGDWFFYSYRGETFSFLKPHFRDGIFSERKGWLVWTPMMACALLGFWPLFRRKKGLFALVALHTALNCWLVFAWDCWWYGGSFGQRAMVQSYALLALPMAAGVEWALEKASRRVIFGSLAAFMLFLNLFQHYQGYLTGMALDCDATTPAFYRRLFLNFRPSRDDLKLLDAPDDFTGIEKRNLELLAAVDLEKRADTAAVERRDGGKKLLLRIDGQTEFVNVGTFFPSKNADWLRLSGLFSIQSRDFNKFRNALLILSARTADGKILREMSWRVMPLLEHWEERELHFDLRIRGLNADRVEAFFWQPNKNAPPFWLRECRVEAFSK